MIQCDVIYWTGGILWPQKLRSKFQIIWNFVNCWILSMKSHPTRLCKYSILLAQHILEKIQYEDLENPIISEPRTAQTPSHKQH